MFKLRIIAVGRRGRDQWDPLIDEYTKRSRSMLPIDFVVVRNIAALVQEVSQPFALFDESGATLDSVQFANWIAKFRDRGEKRLDFAIGDAYGFSSQQKDQAEQLLALSNFTLPHRLAQLVVAEQLYRAGTILAGHPYHHGN